MAKDQEMLDTEAIKIAAAAQNSAERAIEIAEANHEKQTAALRAHEIENREHEKEHEKENREQFAAVAAKIENGFVRLDTKISSTSGGMYNRMWGFLLIIMAGLGALASGLLLKGG